MQKPFFLQILNFHKRFKRSSMKANQQCSLWVKKYFLMIFESFHNFYERNSGKAKQQRSLWVGKHFHLNFTFFSTSFHNVFTFSIHEAQSKPSSSEACGCKNIFLHKLRSFLQFPSTKLAQSQTTVRKKSNRINKSAS